MLVRGINPDGDLQHVAPLIKALRDYSTLIEPWARSVAAFMLADVARRDERMWKQNAKDMGVALRAEIEHAPTGALMQRMLNEQVRLIKSIPLDAAERVHELTVEGMITSTRAKEIAKKIQETSNVSESKARLIARTEVARTASLLTEARARSVGSEGYIWRTVGDGNVRDSHKEMEGKYVRWDTVPKLSDGTQTHAGQIYNCRCFAEPVLPDY